jgi:diaminopimelate decarboxylase
MTPENRQALRDAASTFGTPLFVYNEAQIVDRARYLRSVFGDLFSVSFAVKCNPNIELLKSLSDCVDQFDISAIGEAFRVREAGWDLAKTSFSGPAKRREELQAAHELGVGEMVCESLEEARQISDIAEAAGAVSSILLRINPSRTPRYFGVNMAGKPSQFGVDEEDLEQVLPAIGELGGVELIGFHIYSGTNCLSEEAVAENFEIFLDLFRRATEMSGILPRRLIFGSGFGLPYLPEDEPLSIEAVRELIGDSVGALRAEPAFAKAELILELGRWIVGPAGYLLTRVVAEKHSRGADIRLCDAGFNNHLAACGMMGSMIRRNWRIENISSETSGSASAREYNLVGPLCTTIDSIASKIRFPSLSVGDVLAIENSGAYGLTASPTRFISHPEPLECLVTREGELRDITESRINRWLDD